MIIRNSIIPVSHFTAINLFGLIFVRRGHSFSDVDLNHERIHTAQMLELLVLGFYLWYLVEWLVLLVRHRNVLRAYRLIRFEREAYDHQADLGYLHRRRLWAWARQAEKSRISSADEMKIIRRRKKFRPQTK